MKKKLSIVGLGRFGQVLYGMFKDDFDLTLYARRPESLDAIEDETVKKTNEIEDIYKSDVIVYAVPISALDSVIESHLNYIKPEHILMDVASVKINSKNVFEKYLKDTTTQALLTHPMFGPDSIKANGGLDGLPFIIDQFSANAVTYAEWIEYLKSKKLKIVEMTAEEHDKIAANSQGLTHFVGRLLGEMNIAPSEIDTLGTKRLHEVMDQTLNDTWELFVDLQNYNPYTKEMRLNIGKSYDKIYNKLLPKRIDPNKLIIGIQGGKGSFNEEAIHHYTKEHNITNYELKYLHTTENVLNALYRGDIDNGQYAMHNSIGGIVTESVQAMSNYKFKIIEEFAIKISHTLMMRPDATLEDIDTIITHPQVLKQCKTNLQNKYPTLNKISGEGELIDHAKVAEALSKKELGKNIATMGSKVLAEIYGLNVIEHDLQDMKENFTSFLFVGRKD